MRKRKIILFSVLAVILLSLVIWAIAENKALQLNTIMVQSKKIPEQFDGFRIAHVSDLHSTEIGKGNEKLLTVLRDSEPDMIAVTGDLLDCRDGDGTVALKFCEEAVKIAPVYYVTGNHEGRLEEELYQTVMQRLQSIGVHVLEDEEELLKRGDASISIVGHKWGATDEIGEISDFEGFQVLLSHHPENVMDYTAGGYELVLSGHAHGGQIRLPWIGGLFAPGQGFFPKYDSGIYRVGDTQLIVSRGIGNSIFPLRFNNPPEVILVILDA